MRKYKRKNKRNKTNKKIIIISTIIIFLLAIGYGAFQSTIFVKVKGHVVCSAFGINKLKEQVVTSGDGLYVDTYEEGRYIYRGSNPDNYIDMDGDLWRIMAIENDGVLKIIKSDVLEKNVFDTSEGRINSDNTYCSDLRNGEKRGCNAWSAVSGTYINGSKTGTVNQNSSLNDYLNTNYYNLLSWKKWIQPYNFYNGGLIFHSNYGTILSDEKLSVWYGNIGLISLGDFYKSSNNSECNEQTDDFSAASKCFNNNYMTKNVALFILNPEKNNSNVIIYIHYNYGNDTHYLTSTISSLSSNYCPATHLKSNIKLCGEGTSEEPYFIISK